MSPATEFKKGHIPANYRSVGEIYIVKDSKGTPYRWIKIKDDGPLKDRRQSYTRYLWERVYGPIPPGGIIRHKDGNQLHDTINNLMLIDRAENARLIRCSPEAEKNRRRALHKALKKRWRDYRKRKREQEKERATLRKKQSKMADEDIQHKQSNEQNIIKVRGKLKSWYECPACGFDWPHEVVPCPKCGSIIRFEKIEHSMSYIQNWNQMKDGAK